MISWRNPFNSFVSEKDIYGNFDFILKDDEIKRDDTRVPTLTFCVLPKGITQITSDKMKFGTLIIHILLHEHSDNVFEVTNFDFDCTFKDEMLIASWLQHMINRIIVKYQLHNQTNKIKYTLNDDDCVVCYNEKYSSAGAILLAEYFVRRNNTTSSLL